MPQDHVLADLLAEWVPDEAQRRKVLVENPARLYGFSLISELQWRLSGVATLSEGQPGVALRIMK